MMPTVVLMVKAPVIGAVKTRLAASLGAERAVEIYRALVERQVRALPVEWAVVVSFDPPGAESEMRAWLEPLRSAHMKFQAQREGDLGQRLLVAASDALGAEGGAVVLIGGDCPYLESSHLAGAAEALTRVDVVLGPARDGGYYLIGLRRAEPTLFAGIDWSSPQVLAQTRERCTAARMRVCELDELEDVDDGASWRRAVAAGVLG